MPDVPVFDPNKPYEVVKPKPPEFDPNKPYEVSGGKPQSTGAAGLLSRMRDALAAGGRGVMQGAGDILYGGAQIGARMGEAPQIGQTQPEMPGGAARVDQAVKQREKAYQGSVAGHPVASAAGRLLGNMAATLPLGMAGGAVARGAGLAGRLATAGAVGSGAGAMQPTEGKDFGKEKLQQAVYGTAGGVVGGAVGEAAGSLLSKAIAGNAPAAVDAALTSQFRRAVRPGKPTPNTGGRTKQDMRILGAVDSIIQAKPDLQLTNQAGQKVTGQLPQSLAQLEEAVGQAKGKVYKEYDDMAKAAGEKDALVDLEPIAKELRKMAEDPAITVHHPEVEQFANAYANRLEAVGRYSAKTAQDSLEVLNQTLRAWWKNPTTATVGSNSVYAKVSEMLRDGLDTAITKLGGSEYQALRNKFGALKSVEDAISRAVTRDQNKASSGGLTGSLSNLVASAEFWRGAATLSPGRIKDAAIIKASQMMMRRLESPNRAIERLFAKREATAGRPPPSPLRSAIGGAMGSPVPAMGGALAGGSLSAPPSARTYFEDPRYNQVQLPSGITVSR